MRRLPDGHYYGKLLRRETVAGIVMTETRYEPRQRLPLHTHERAYICLVRRGAYTEQFAARTREVGPSTLAFHPPGEMHTQQIHDTEVSSFNIELSPSWLERTSGTNAPLVESAEFRGGPIASLARKLYREFRQPDAMTPLAVEGLLLELLAEAGRTREQVISRQTPPWLSRVKNAVLARFDEPVSLSELAREVGIHPAYLAASFRRHCGCTVGDYLRRQRVDYACRRLTKSDVSLADIALEAGFADQSHFTRVFSRLTGQTPGQFRRTALDA